MKLSITATDKPQKQDFHYELEISDTQIIITTLAICGTLLLYKALKR